MQIPASSWTTEEFPFQKRKPLCERYLHRWIRSSFPIRSRRQPGLGKCRQGIEIKRLAHKRELAEKSKASPKKGLLMALPVLGAKLSS
jgi:hypothetical protein